MDLLTEEDDGARYIEARIGPKLARVSRVADALRALGTDAAYERLLRNGARPPPFIGS